jgi:integrase/recombinase XerD
MGFHADSQREPGAGVRMSGPLAPFTAGFRRELAGRGYTSRSITDQLRLAARLSRWLEGQGLTAGQVTVPVAGEFFRARRARGYRKWLTSRSLSWLPACLPGAFVPDSAAGDAPVDPLLASYRGYLLAERGLAAGTVTHYLRFAGEFLRWLPGPLDAGLAGLSAGQVTTFVMAWCPRRSPAQPS